MQDGKKINKKDDKNIRPADIILFVAIIMLALGVLAWGKNRSTSGHAVSIQVEGSEITELPLDEDTEYTVSNQYGTNKITVSSGQVSVDYADCPDRICVDHSSISKKGDVIICLPHKLVVEINDE